MADQTFEGADAVFWLVLPNPQATLEQAYLDFTRPAAEALRNHGVSRVVWRHRAQARNGLGGTCSASPTRNMTNQR